MNLNELVLRLHTPPEKGAHEIVHGPDDASHLVIVTMARVTYKDGINVREFSFGTWRRLSAVKARDLSFGGARTRSTTTPAC